MEADAIICTSCGYNTETGEEMESAVVATPPPPPGSKKKKKKAKAASPADAEAALCKKLMFLPPVVLGAMFLGGFIHPMIFLAGAGLWGLSALVVGIWNIIAAFQDGILQGLLVLFIPFYAFIYIYFVNARRTLKAAFTGVILAWVAMFLCSLILPSAKL